MSITSITQAVVGTKELTATLPAGNKGAVIKSISVPVSVNVGALSLIVTDSVGVRFLSIPTSPVAVAGAGYYINTDIHCVGATTVVFEAATSMAGQSPNILHVTYESQ